MTFSQASGHISFLNWVSTVISLNLLECMWTILDCFSLTLLTPRMQWEQSYSECFKCCREARITFLYRIITTLQVIWKTTNSSRRMHFWKTKALPVFLIAAVLKKKRQTASEANSLSSCYVNEQEVISWRLRDYTCPQSHWWAANRSITDHFIVKHWVNTRDLWQSRW